MEPFDRYQLQEKRREQSHTAKQVPPHERDRLPNERATSQNPNPLDALSALTPPPELVLRKSDGVLNKGRREFADKPKPMNKQTRKTELLYDGFIAAPGCPFTAGALFCFICRRQSFHMASIEAGNDGSTSLCARLVGRGL